MPKNRLLNFNHKTPDLALLNTPGKPVQLSRLWVKRPLLLAFTRHFGCTQCKEMPEELVGGRERIEKAVALALRQGLVICPIFPAVLL